VLLDILMPKRNGMDVLLEIRDMDPACKVIMLSSLGTEDVVTKCIHEGALTFIQKPVQQEALLAQLRCHAD
ncbi:MAG: response regulator, partial [Verrucomicrobiota bacterium]